MIVLVLARLALVATRWLAPIPERSLVVSMAERLVAELVYFAKVERRREL